MSQQLPQDFFPFQPAEMPPPRRRSGVTTAVAVVVLVLAVMVILNESLLRVKWVAVMGNETIPWETVVQAAGLDGAVGFFALNETKIAQGVESNRYLVYEGLEKQFPNRVTLYVRERAAVVKVQEMGANYFLSADGMVLHRGGSAWEEDEPRLNEDSLIIVTGLKPKELRVGRIMTAGSSDRMDAFLQLLEELRLQGFMDQVAELNITNSESLYLITRDGYTANLGDIGSLRAKIGTVRAVVAKLREMGLSGGMLAADTPGEAIYTPAIP